MNAPPFAVAPPCAALLQLRVTDRPYCAKESRFVKTACLPDRPFSSGTECVISGWGATETRKSPLKPFANVRTKQENHVIILGEYCHST